MGEDDSGSSCVAILDYPLPMLFLKCVQYLFYLTTKLEFHLEKELEDW